MTLPTQSVLYAVTLTAIGMASANGQDVLPPKGPSLSDTVAFLKKMAATHGEVTITGRWTDTRSKWVRHNTTGLDYRDGTLVIMEKARSKIDGNDGQRMHWRESRKYEGWLARMPVKGLYNSFKVTRTDYGARIDMTCVEKKKCITYPRLHLWVMLRRRICPFASRRLYMVSDNSRFSLEWVV